MPGTILVTGGAGYVGSHVVRALAERGYGVVTYDAFITGHRAALRWGDVVRGDLLDRPRLASVFASRRIDAVVHLAALSQVAESVRHRRRYWRNNVDGSAALLDAMGAAGVDKVVFSSSACVYGAPRQIPIGEEHPLAPDNPYGETKVAVERALRDAPGVTAVSLRYFNAAGAHPDGSMGEDHRPESHLLPRVLRATPEDPLRVFGRDYPTPDGTAIRDYVHVWDLAAAHLAAVRYLLDGGPHLVCNLGSGEGASVRQVIAAVERVTGRRVPVREDERRPGDVPRLVASRQRASRILGWRPERDLDAIVADAARWHRTHPRGYAR